MTTGHYNPGYGDSIPRFNKTQAAQMSKMSPGANNLKALRNVGADTVMLEEIRQRAREAWLYPRRANETSYQDHYQERDIVESTNTRPTSSSRKNKPHPDGVFLVTHLHEVPGDRRHTIPGLHNADASLGKPPYLADGSVSPTEQGRRVNMRRKFLDRPHTASLKQYEAHEELDVIKDPIERQATDAWLKLANDKDKENVLASLRELSDEELKDTRGPALERSYRPFTVAAMNRYMRHAGAQEARNVTQLYNKHVHDYHPSPGRTPVDIVTMRKKDLYNTRYCLPSAPAAASRRGDYLIHPEWTPSMSHHRLNGLSTVDQPYSFSKR